jgi:hypothetical protein
MPAVLDHLLRRCLCPWRSFIIRCAWIAGYVKLCRAFAEMRGDSDEHGGMS